MEAMRACACGERNTTSQAWPGRLRSSLYRPLPASSRSSSRRFCEREEPKRADAGSNCVAGTVVAFISAGKETPRRGAPSSNSEYASLLGCVAAAQPVDAPAAVLLCEIHRSQIVAGEALLA